METDRSGVASPSKPLILNVGCGFRKHPDGVNVDGFTACNPDVLWNLNKFPYPWEDNQVDQIYAYHVFEHLEDWWGALRECARILKLGGLLEIRVPDISSDTAIAYRDHLQVLNLFSFDGIANRTKGRDLNSWAGMQEIVPLVLIRYARVPFAEYNWMPVWLLKFCAKHFRNFIWEQRLLFTKISLKHFGKIEYKYHPQTEFLKKMRKYNPAKENL